SGGRIAGVRGAAVVVAAVAGGAGDARAGAADVGDRAGVAVGARRAVGHGSSDVAGAALAGVARGARGAVRARRPVIERGVHAADRRVAVARARVVVVAVRRDAEDARAVDARLNAVACVAVVAVGVGVTRAGTLTPRAERDPAAALRVAGDALAGTGGVAARRAGVARLAGIEQPVTARALPGDRC